MANNNNQIPIQFSGRLPKDCYSDPNELIADAAKCLTIPSDNTLIIKGAEGPKGTKGDRGAVGPAGPAGTNGANAEVKQSNVAIGSGVTYVEFPVFNGWEFAIYGIRTNAKVGGTPNFVPADGIVGVGTIVAVDTLPSPVNIRCYFVFAGGITATPNANFYLKITSLL